MPTPPQFFIETPPGAYRLVIDASAGVTHQDQRLAERVDGAGTAIVVVLNKWDLIDDADARKQVLEDVHDRLGFLGYAPVLKVSALTGRKIDDVLPALRQAEEAYHQRVPTAALNRLLQDAQAQHPPQRCHNCSCIRCRRPCNSLHLAVQLRLENRQVLSFLLNLFHNIGLML